MDKEKKQQIFTIALKGEVEVRGKVIKHLEGGFGENCKIISDRDIATQHDVTPSDIRKLINRNINRFKEGVDYVDISKGSHEMTTSEIENFGYKKTSITQASNIYILSERGYSKIIKIMDTDLAWEIYDDLLDNYFTMRKVINSDEQLKKELLYDLYTGGITSVEAHKKLVEIETRELTNKIEVMQPSVDMAQKRRSSDGLYTYTDCQKKFGLKQGQVGCFFKIKGYVHWNKKETTKLGDDTGFVRQYGEEFPSIGVTELGLKYLEDNLEELKVAPCKLPKNKQTWLDEKINN